MDPTQASSKAPYPAAAGGVPQYPQPFATQGYSVDSTPVEWSTGLCDCFHDPGNCCITCCCPCITSGQIAEVVDRGTTSCGVASFIYFALSCAGCPCIYSCGYRTKLRSMYSLKEAPCGDCLTHCFCDYCALCQEYRELKLRGTDPSIGWQGNIEKWNRAGSTMPPAVASGMMR